MKKCLAVLAVLPLLLEAVPAEPQFLLEELTDSSGKKETWRTVKPKEDFVTLRSSARTIDPEAAEYQVTLTNRSDKPLFLRYSARLPVPEKSVCWNGYLRKQEQFDPGDKNLSTWFPALAAIADKKAHLLGLNPLDLVSRVDAGEQQINGKKCLILQLPVYIEPGKSCTFRFVSAEGPGDFGGRDAVQRWYDLFPEAFQPAPGIDPKIISGEAGYLFWNREKSKLKNPEELLRRFCGGLGTWEWCYKGFVRGGDWTISDKYTIGFEKYRTRKQVEAARERTRKRYRPAESMDVSPVWYLNVCWTGRSLWKEHFPEIALPNHTLSKCWQQPVIRGVYCWGGAYGKLFQQSIINIPRLYPDARGIGWDSCFAHAEIPADHAGFAESDPKSFYHGKPMAIEAVGVSRLLDLNRSQRTEKYPMANVVNFKLVAPYMIGVRTDGAMYEGNPMEKPNRLYRIETMRARLGSPKGITFHKHLEPDRIGWIPWKKLSRPEAEDIYRQLSDNTLFLCYFWGFLPAPQLPAVGVRRMFEAVPELTSLIRQGWQPAPAVKVKGEILTARYGKGNGARIALINPENREQNITVDFPASRWEGKVVLAAAENGTAAVNFCSETGTGVKITLPPRSCTLLRAAALIEPQKAEVQTCRQGNRYCFNSRSKIDHADFFTAESGTRAVLGNARFGSGEKRTAALEPGENVFEEIPLHDMRQLDVPALKKLDLVRKAETGMLAIIVPEKELRREAKRIADWFAFYTQFGNAAPPVPVAEQAPAGAAVIRLISDAKAFRPGELSRAVVNGDELTISLASPGAAHQAVLALLRSMDLAWPYCGVLPENGGFRGIGLNGKVLEPAPIVKELHPTLMEMIRRQRLIF
ncbi:MAG: hypothetical protein IJH79_16780 [Lentisphaeria bacterium]|nr:hypothetical protein [Lentisphaeria bacterium]